MSTEHWWTALKTGKSLLQKITFEAFCALVDAAPAGRNMREIIVHHTWSPTVAQYQGQETWNGIRNYHVNSRGWSDIGYHVGIDPKGGIWLLRPLQRTGGHCLGKNETSIGLVVLGNYDIGKDKIGEQWSMAKYVTAILAQRFKLTEANVYFHRDFADKSCPGTAINRASFRLDVRKLMADDIDRRAEEPAGPGLRIIEHGTGRVLWPAADEGKWEVVSGGNHVEDQGKVYVRGAS